MNWSLIIVGLVALSSVAIAENSYLIFAPKLFKVGYENQLSVFIAAASQPVEVKYILTVGPKRVEGKITVNAGETRNASLALPMDFPVGPGELIMTGTGGIRFEERRDLIVYDNSHVMLVQASASTYRPGDTMEIRVVVTNEELLPIEQGEMLVEIYDSALKLVGRFPQLAIKSGLTETIRYPICEHSNLGTWLVSAIIGNSTSSLEILVSEPVTPSFDLKAIFQRFVLRTEKSLRGVIEIDSDNNEPIFGRAYIAVGPLTEVDVERMKTEKTMQKLEKEGEESWRKWKYQEVDVAGRIEFNYDLLSIFNIDISKALALQVYVRVVDLVSGQERFIQHIVPVFTRDVVYDIRPLEFTSGMMNEFQVIAKRPDGKPSKMEDMIVTVTMMIGDAKGKVQEEKSVEVKEFYTRGRNDIGFFNVEIPETCIGVLMTITPLGDDGKIRGYRTHAVPLMPTPRREVPTAKLTIELLPSMIAPAGNDPKAPLVSSQVSTVGRTSNFYIQLLPTKPVEKFEPLPMSYILMSNGRIINSGEFMIKPTKECQSKATRSIQPEVQQPPTCLFNGTLPIEMTRAMVPYSTLLVYTFQPSFGFNVAESYRFSVAGLFKGSLALNATIVPYSIVSAGPEGESEEFDVSSEEFNGKQIQISGKAQDKTRVQLSFTGTPDAVVGYNVIEYDGVMQGLTSEITKERLLNYLTSYEQVPIVGMPSVSSNNGKKTEQNMQTRGVLSEQDEMKQIERESMGFKLRYPLEKMVFGVNSQASNKPIESDDIYAASNMDRFYGDERNRQSSTSSSHYRRKSMKSMNQYDVTVNDNDYVVATSYPLIFTLDARMEAEERAKEEKQASYDDEVERVGVMGDSPRPHGSPAWYEKMQSRLSEISQEAFIFMQSGLNVMSDFPSLRLPSDMQRVNLTTLFSRYRQQSNIFDDETFSDRDHARVVLEQYLMEADLSMVPPPVLLEEQARLGYYRSVSFNTSRIGAEGTSKVVLPRTKPYSTWLATGFSLHSKSGLAIAQPIRLPTNQGLFVLGSFVDQIQIGERALLTYGINNYLGKDLTNVIVRIHGSSDFDLMDGERVVSTVGKDYTLTIPSLKIFAVETRNITVVPKRAGVVKIVIEVESEFGGDYEVLTTYVRETGIRREQRTMRLFDLTEEKKTSGPIAFKVNNVPTLRSIRLSVSGTGLDRLVERYSMETGHLMGIDRAIIRLWRAIGLRRYLNETSQTESYLEDAAESNITMAYQKLQLYSTYNGSYSFISDEGLEESSFYLTTLSFGALVSPFMTIRDNVTINRTLTWLLAHQQQDGSFEDNGPCYHFRFCSGEFRREGLTALFYYAMTRDNVSNYLPEFVRRQLWEGEQSPMMRAHRFLETRYETVKSCFLTTSLLELVLSQSKLSTPQLREKIMGHLRSRQLTVVPEDGSKFFKYNNERVTYDDQLLVNAIMLSTYANFGDYQTASLIARWAVQQFEMYPYHDTVLDAIFGTEAWLRMDYLYRQFYSMDKFAVVVDVTTDNGQKQQFKLNRDNIDLTQKLRFTLPVNQITYTVSGFGFVCVEIRQIFYEKQQEKMQPSPFQLTAEFTPAPYHSDIRVKTCMTYTPTAKELQKAKETFNRTVVIEFELPSGTRINLRQIGFALSQIENMMYFTFDERKQMINFFVNMPQTSYGKPMCFDWIMERLSYVMTWTSVQVHAYDYLQQDTELTRLFPIQFQPTVAGYAFVNAVHEARPTLEQIAEMRKQMETKQ